MSERFVSGTESWDTWPQYPEGDPMRKHKGIFHYGRHTIGGISAVKVARENRQRLEGIGWKCIHEGTYYSYMVEGEGLT